MLNVKKYLEENRSIKKAQSRTLFALLSYYSTERYKNKKFPKQSELVDAVSNALELEKPLTGAAMCKTLKKLAGETLLIENDTFYLCKKDGKYGLHPAEKGMPALARLGDLIYEKTRVHVLSKNTLVFHLRPGKADLFVSTIKENFDNDIFFGIGTQNDQLVYLLFNKKHKYGAETFKQFKGLFKHVFDKAIQNE